MTALRRHTDFIRLVAVVLTGTFLSACMTWQTQTLQPERFQSADSTQTLRLTLTSGDTVIVHAPIVAHDSLLGLRTPAGVSSDSLERVSIPLAAISQAEGQKDNTPVGILAFVVAVATIAALANTCFAPCWGH